LTLLPVVMKLSVAPGTYTGDGNRDIDFLGKAIIPQLKRPRKLRRDLPAEHRIVTLRIYRDVHFAEAQYAQAAIAASTATDIQLAVLKNKRTSPQ